MTMAWSMIQISVVVVVVLSGGTESQLNSGPSAIFNEFINDNSIVSSTAPSSGQSSGEESSSPASRSENRLLRMRQWQRNQRLQSLRLQILQSLGMDQPPTVTISPEARNRVMESLDRFPALSNFVHPLHHSERRCYSASCNVPHKVNETLWRNSSSRGLRLFVPIPRDRNNETILQSATLHLFLKPNAVRQVQCECEGEEGEGEGRACRTVNGFLVQVYQYVRPLSVRRRGRVVNRRRLLDAKFIPVTNTWLSFNIRNVASDWRRHRRNFGVEVTMQDDNDTEIDANAMFVLPDCTVGREIGCRESSSSDNSHGLPYFVSYRDNFPYVDLVALRTRSSSSSSRSRRSLRHDTRHPPASPPRHQDLSTSLAVLPRPSCEGQEVVVNITDPDVEEPRSFISRVCPSQCWDCAADGQCTPRACSAPKTEAVPGLYRLQDGSTRHRILPFTRIVACGC
ncbi:uncharacterized protein LOC143279343 [Babylonia areolata]|uniref:uncharacterized protein LOC143279343 n=1 Tax=Babylonia areolata TaxID=304850 RepID=UPI003FD0AC2E